MPIEPSSVSKPVVREVENAPGMNFWSSTQGSSTGGKESHFSSIWEKTVHGAQKLFGLETSEQAVDDADSDKSDRSKADSSHQNTDTSNFRFGSVPGFGRRAFGSGGFGHFIRERGGANQFAGAERSIEAGNPREMNYSRGEDAMQAGERALDRDLSNRMQSRECTGSSHGESARPLVKDTGNRQGAQAEAIDEKAAENSETGRRQVKVATPVTLPVIQSEARVGEGTGAAASQAASPVQNSSEVTHLATQEIVPLVSSPAESVATSSKSAMEVPGALQTTSKQTQQPSIVAPVQAVVENGNVEAKAIVGAQGNTAVSKPTPSSEQKNETSNTVSGEKAALAAQAKSADKPMPVEAQETVETDLLSIDSEKAKSALSEALKKGTQNRTAKANTGAGTQPVISADAASKAAGSESQRIVEPSSDAKAPVVQDISAKEVAVVSSKITSGQSAAKAVTVEQAVARQQSVETPSDIVATSSVQRNQSANTVSAQGARVAPSVPRPVGVQSPNSPAGQSGVSVAGATGVSGGSLNTANAGVKSQLQGGDSGDQTKQDAAMQLKNGSIGKGTEKSSGDAGQAFDVKEMASDSSKKTQAAAKARPTSYVSKTADELKEIVATMTKSIDRLVTNKGGAMNLKINFDQGGSMTLRISMEGSQVNTSMQTDLVGLEGMIKSNWTELAGDWNQKGVKLNAPQFQQGAGQGNADTEAESWNEFAQKQQDRQSGFNGSTRSARNLRSGQSTNSGPEAMSEGSVPIEKTVPDVISDKELKTYA